MGPPTRRTALVPALHRTGSRHDQGVPTAEDRVALNDEDPATVSRTLLRLALEDDDGDWIEEQCLRLADHPDAGVRGTALLCLGHIARRFRRVRPESWATARRLCADDVDQPYDPLDVMRRYAGPAPAPPGYWLRFYPDYSAEPGLWLMNEIGEEETLEDFEYELPQDL